MWIIAGLGNPGPRYAQTAHNFGFEVCRLLAERHGLVFGSSRLTRGHVAEGHFAGQKVFLLLPTTYMNLSGEAVAPLARYYRIDPEHVLAICDDVAIPWGRVRLRGGGSHGGHNGLRSIIQHLGTDGFPRLRIGCKPENWRGDLAAYVLAPLRGEALDLARHMTDVAADAVEYVLREGVPAAQNVYNGYDALRVEEE